MIESNLRENEKVIFEAVISNVIKGLWLILIVIDSIFLFSVNSPIFIPTLLLILVIGIYQMIKISKMELYYTNKRVVGKIGIFTIHTLDTPLNKVNNIAIRKSILGYGTITISSSSGNYNFKYITNAEEIRNRLMEEIEKYEQEKIREQAIEMAKAMKQ